MTKALLTFDARSQKWQATHAGKVVVESQNKNYVRDVIRKGLNAKAKSLGIDDVEELSSSTFIQSTGEQVEAPKLIEFDINERFEFLKDYIDMVAARDMKSCVVVGEGGLGKSYTVMGQLAKNGLRDLYEMEIGASLDEANSRNSFVIVKGYSTPKGLFRTLYENRNRLVVFDDCDSILRDETSTNLLKAALDSYDKRIVTWNAESFGESDLPKSFEFTGAVIFISNMSMNKIPQALISRSAPADVSMTRTEIIDRMRQIVREGEFLAEIDMDIKMEALDYIASQIHNPQIKTFNLRTLIAVVTNRRCKPQNWQRLSLSMMMAAR